MLMRGVYLFAPMSGCKVVMPGMNMDGESIYELLNDHKVTFTAAVPSMVDASSIS